MITLRAIDGDLSFQVYDDGEPIGHIWLHIGLTGEKYLASVDKDGEKTSAGLQEQGRIWECLNIMLRH